MSTSNNSKRGIFADIAGPENIIFMKCIPLHIPPTKGCIFTCLTLNCPFKIIS